VIFTIGWFLSDAPESKVFRAFALSVFIGHALALALAAALIFRSWPTEEISFLQAPIRALSGRTFGLLLKDVVMVVWGVVLELVAPPTPVRMAGCQSVHPIR